MTWQYCWIYLFMSVGWFCFYEAVINWHNNSFKWIKGKYRFEVIVGETAHYVRWVWNSSEIQMQGRNRCEGRGLAMLSDPLCVTQVLAEAQESRDRLTGHGVRDLTSKSSSEYRTLFLWRGWGQGERRKHQWPRLNLSISVCVDLLAPLFNNKRRANMHRLPNMIQIFLQCQGKKLIIQSIST